MLIEAPPEEVYRAFIEPDRLTRFWLSKASGPLRKGEPIEWQFMVKGVKETVTATQLEPGKHIAWRWSDGEVDIDLEPLEGGTAVALTHAGFSGTEAEKVDAALNSTEGFTIVLCDLKTLLESGVSANLTKSKARLIEARQ
jgi:uncharacterized protein YndB with AHSA1/START domain